MNFDNFKGHDYEFHSSDSIEPNGDRTYCDSLTIFTPDWNNILYHKNPLVINGTEPGDIMIDGNESN